MFKKISLSMALLLATSSLVFASDSMDHSKNKTTKPIVAKFKVDSKKSKLKWTGKKVTGQHYGLLKVKEGDLRLENGHLKGGEFVIDMTSISVTDGTGPDWAKKLIGHLNNDDFFQTNKHKTAKLKIKDVMMGKGGTYNVTADLTIKGITKPVLFDVDLLNGKKEVRGRAKIKFNRLDYKIQYKSGSLFKNLGDKMIYDDVYVDVDLVAKK